MSVKERENCRQGGRFFLQSSRFGTLAPLYSARGFTILELVVYLGVLSLILLAATQFAMEFALTRAKAAALQETSRNARFAISRVAADIREAVDVNFGSSTLGVNPSILSLASSVPSVDPTVFAVSNGALTIKQGAGPVLPLTNSKVSVTDFTVTNLSMAGRNKIYRIKVTLQSINPGALQTFDSSYTFETTAAIQKSDGFSN